MLDHYFDVIVTVCDSARENCPIYPGGTELLHHDFEDPASFEGPVEERVERFRRVRDEIRGWIMQRFGERAS
jgi:arsenate reductase